jgi:hypothetical protein
MKFIHTLERNIKNKIYYVCKGVVQFNMLYQYFALYNGYHQKYVQVKPLREVKFEEKK